MVTGDSGCVIVRCDNSGYGKCDLVLMITLIPLIMLTVFKVLVRMIEILALGPVV